MKHCLQTTALVLTSILSLGAGITLIKAATADSVEGSQGAASEILKRRSEDVPNPKQSGANQLARSAIKLPSAVANAVLQAASQRTGLRTSQLRIVKIEQIQTNGCLDLPRPGEGCTKINMQAREVTVEGRQQRLVYRANSNGSQVRLNEKASSIGENNMRQKVANIVLGIASELTGLPTSELRIVNFEEIVTDSCLGLPRATEGCLNTLNAWQLTVEGGQQRLVYRANPSGYDFRLNEAASRITLPKRVGNAVLQNASQQSGLPISALRIVASLRQHWADGCDRPTFPYPCDPVVVSGWQVTVESGQKRWVYLTDERGSHLKLYQGNSQTGNANLPKSVADAALQDASGLLLLPISHHSLIWMTQ